MKRGTYTKIMAAHETRMWIGQVIIPSALAIGVISQTEFGRKVGQKIKMAGKKVKEFFTKKK